jgi:hypothetical protein
MATMPEAATPPAPRVTALGHLASVPAFRRRQGGGEAGAVGTGSPGEATICWASEPAGRFAETAAQYSGLHSIGDQRSPAGSYSFALALTAPEATARASSSAER